MKGEPCRINEFADWAPEEGDATQLDLLSGSRMQRLERDGRLPNGPFEPIGWSETKSNEHQ
jgi:hypothetical protein